MNCPKCKQKMTKARTEITSNLKSGEDYKEYEKLVYQCKTDDIWVTIETPKTK